MTYLYKSKIRLREEQANHNKVFSRLQEEKAQLQRQLAEVSAQRRRDGKQKMPSVEESLRKECTRLQKAHETMIE